MLHLGLPFGGSIKNAVATIAADVSANPAAP
jgi:hypothetical protein